MRGYCHAYGCSVASLDRHLILGGSNERGPAAAHRSDANLADVFRRDYWHRWSERYEARRRVSANSSSLWTFERTPQTWRRPRPDGGVRAAYRRGSCGALWACCRSSPPLSNLRRRPPWIRPQPRPGSQTGTPRSSAQPATPTPRLARLAASAASTERVIITQPQKLTLHGEILYGRPDEVAPHPLPRMPGWVA